jgi:uncharacterized protein
MSNLPSSNPLLQNLLLQNLLLQGLIRVQSQEDFVMPASTASVASPSARKYMIQLCKHWSHKLVVSWDDDKGRIEFDGSRVCIMHNDQQTLHLRVETNGDDELERTQQTVVNHLKRFAFREEFGDITWTKEAGS